MSAAYDIPMQPRYFRRLRRLIWTWRCFLEYRERLDVDLWLQGDEPWPLGQCWQLARATAQNQADSNDRDGFAWDTPDEAVQSEFDCWSN